MSDTKLFQNKLAAWLSRPWYEAFVPKDDIEKRRTQWRQESYALFGLAVDESHFVEGIDQTVDEDEALPREALPADVKFLANPIFLHPLSGVEKRLELRDGAPVNINDLHETCMKALKRVAEVSGKDPFLALVALWRCAAALSRSMEEAGQTQLGAFWDLVPAYAAVPIFTIWQRQAAAAALASAGEKPAFLSFRIGGVQEFIGKSRTTEDYWAGSYLISYLTWQAAKKIAKELGPDNVVFPALRGQPLVDTWLAKELKLSKLVTAPGASKCETGNFPNGLLAIVPYTDEQAACDFAKEVVSEFAGEWETICRNVKKALEKELTSLPVRWNEIWDRQTKADRVFELFWTLTSRRAREKYADWYRRSSREMEARKALRDFRSTREKGTKCHQTGLGEALSSDKDFWNSMAKLAKPFRFRFREFERLSAVSVVRRVAVRCHQPLKNLAGPMSFPSTSSIAATPLVKNLVGRTDLTTEAEDFSNELAKLLKNQNGGKMGQTPYPPCVRSENNSWHDLLLTDGSWWYEASYEPKALNKQSFDWDEVERKAALVALRDLLKKAKASPANYYAILAADGDEAGQWINGSKLEDWCNYSHPDVRLGFGSHPRQGSLLTHLAVMECLANLPLCGPANQIAGLFLGKLVYSGGDDMLAFVPASELADGMDKYAQLFSQNFIEVNDGYALLPGRKFTVSAAAMLAPYRTPMSGLVQEALKLVEEQAKKTYGRNSGVVTVRRQSGQETLAGVKWGDDFRPFAFAQELAKDFASPKGLSGRFIAHITEMRPALENLADYNGLEAMLRSIFARAEGERERRRWLVERAIPILTAWDRGKYPTDYDKPAWSGLEDFLLTVRFLSRMLIV